MLALGMEDASTFLNHEIINDLLKTALPHKAKYIEQNKTAGYHDFLEELKQNLMNELKKMLDGKDTDDKSLAQSLAIMYQVKKADDERQRAEIVETQEAGQNARKTG